MNREDQVRLSRTRIIRAAVAEFGAYSYESASTNHMCEGNGISKGLLYHYFKNKGQLFTVCAQICLEQLEAYLQAHFEAPDTLYAALKSYSILCVRFFQENKDYLRIYYGAIFQMNPALREMLKPVVDGWHRFIAENLDRFFSRTPLKPSITHSEALALAAGLLDNINRCIAENKLSCGEAQAQKLEEEIGGLCKVLLYGIAENV